MWCGVVWCGVVCWVVFLQGTLPTAPCTPCTVHAALCTLQAANCALCALCTLRRHTLQQANRKQTPVLPAQAEGRTTHVIVTRSCVAASAIFCHATEPTSAAETSCIPHRATHNKRVKHDSLSTVHCTPHTLHDICGTDAMGCYAVRCGAVRCRAKRNAEDHDVRLP